MPILSDIHENECNRLGSPITVTLHAHIFIYLTYSYQLAIVISKDSILEC